MCSGVDHQGVEPSENRVLRERDAFRKVIVTITLSGPETLREGIEVVVSIK